MGERCSSCRQGACRDAPTKNSPICVRLPGRTQPLRITECPNQFCGENARQLVRLAHFAREGCMPIAGGTLDQAQSFMEACRFAWAFEDEIKAAREHAAH